MGVLDPPKGGFFIAHSPPLSGNYYEWIGEECHAEAELSERRRLLDADHNWGISFVS